jgi:hypothetical protein
MTTRESVGIGGQASGALPMMMLLFGFFLFDPVSHHYNMYVSC